MNCPKAAVAIGIFILAFSGLTAADTALSLEQYRQQLHDISEKVRSLDDHAGEAGSIITAIPDQVTVSTAERAVTVNYHPLKDALASFSKAASRQQPQHLQQIGAYVASLESEAAAYDKSVAESAMAQQQLGGILARREFRNVRSPGLREKLLGMLYRWLGRLFGRMRVVGAAGFNALQVLVYSIVGVALLMLVWWTINRFRQSEAGLPAREIIPFSPSARSWRAWLAEAREHAEQKDWRNAIHLAYWAGISFLESGGAWKPNRARTPREYLRLLNTRNPNYPPLSALTRKFEVVWYGDRPAARQDFQETLGHLEKLGCH